MDKGLGSITWWGFSPAVDLLEYYELAGFDASTSTPATTSSSKSASASERESGDVGTVGFDLKILLVGCGDIRHVIKSLAKLLRGNTTIKAVHFYILENSLELYARAMLLLSLIFEDPEFMGLQEKAELFAEIYGNSLVRQQTASYIQRAANDFVQMVTDFDYLKEMLPFFDLESLKYKEIDMLEGIFKLWRKPETSIFNIENCWDLRVRQHLGTRYDSANGAFDWDYSMKLSDRGAEIIGSRLYQRWRKTGVAFQLREGNYDVPNKTLASGMIFHVEGERLGRRGYWGDIVVSPFISFGIECSEDSFFKRANKQFISDSEQITQHNLTSLFHQIQTGKPYIKPAEDTSPKQPSMATVTEEEEDEDQQNVPKKKKTYLPCENVKFTFLPLNSLPGIGSKAKYEKLFDVVYLSNSMVHHLGPVANTFSDNSLVILETAKFITELTRDQYIEFVNKIDRMAKDVGCETMIDINPEKDAFAFYKHQQG